MPKPRKSTFDEPYIEIINRLIARRQRLGMSQTAFGNAYGEDQTFVSRVERRQRRLDVWEFVRWCRILDIDPAYVLEGID